MLRPLRARLRVRPEQVRPRWRGVSVLAAMLALGLAAVATTASCGQTGAQWRSPADSATVIMGGAKLIVYPLANARNISPADPVTAEIVGGVLETVTLTSSSGKAVKGEFRSDQKTWRNAEHLDYNKTYTLTIKGIGADGEVHDETRKFTTVNPRNQTLPTMLAYSGECAVPNDEGRCLAGVPQGRLDGGTFGVGQLIIVTFDEPIKDRTAAERNLIVTTDKPVVGAWSWRSAREVRWRPKNYWPAYTKVTVEAKIYGRDLGGGLYGQCVGPVAGSCDRRATFSIGASKILVADSITHRMKVFIDGEQKTVINGKDVTAGIPISMGKDQREALPEGGYVDFRTQSGPHIITTKMPLKRMTSASFGIKDPESPNYYDVKIKMSIRISVDGEFVHLADWNIPAHGKYNTSHGCINVAPTYIYWLYDNLGPGDVVDVRNTGRSLTLGTGGDWVLSWEKWLKGSALS